MIRTNKIKLLTCLIALIALPGQEVLAKTSSVNVNSVLIVAGGCGISTSNDYLKHSSNTDVNYNCSVGYNPNISIPNNNNDRNHLDDSSVSLIGNGTNQVATIEDKEDSKNYDDNEAKDKKIKDTDSNDKEKSKKKYKPPLTVTY
jgi:hypothetical protein